MRARNGLRHLDNWLAPRWSRGTTALARPALATAAAIRVPDRVSSQLAVAFPTASPQLFVHEGARRALERKLMAACQGRTVVLSITDNRHSIISHSTKHGVLHARVHFMFLDAPPRVVDALVRYVTRDDRSASQIVGAYIEANGAKLARRRPRAIPIAAKGETHDLLAIFADLNDKYFGGACHALITWGRRTRRKRGAPRQAIKLGSYSSLERLIRIHPVLDKPWVPRYFVAYVVYHEMLHHMIPSARGTVRGTSSVLASASARGAAHRRRALVSPDARSGFARRVLHPPEFLERERQFRKYDRALDWERRHIARLLRAS
jgi:hypothetical protein